MKAKVITKAERVYNLIELEKYALHNNTRIYSDKLPVLREDEAVSVFIFPISPRILLLCYKYKSTAKMYALKGTSRGDVQSSYRTYSPRWLNKFHTSTTIRGYSCGVLTASERSG